MAEQSFNIALLTALVTLTSTPVAALPAASAANQAVSTISKRTYIPPDGIAGISVTSVIVCIWLFGLFTWLREKWLDRREGRVSDDFDDDDFEMKAVEGGAAPAPA